MFPLLRQSLAQLASPSPFRWAVLSLLALILAAAFLWGDRRLAHTLAQVPPQPPPSPDTPATPSTDQPSTPAPPPTRQPTTAELIGLQNLEKLLGPRTPTGRGIIAGHVEGSTGDYAPDLESAKTAGLQLVLRSGPSKTNGHAQATARIIYGPGGLAPGIPQVHSFSTDHFLSTGVLNINSPQPPSAGPIRLFNHSWIGLNAPHTSDILRRLDYLADQHDVLFVVGVNNGAASPVPPLLASAYNVIAVGLLSGDSSGNYTTVEVPGRCKPDLVAPGSLTSFATPLVTAVCARLLEAADAMSQFPQARRSELLRAILLAGAEKLPHWNPQPGKPLDSHLGAGLVRIDHSHRILSAGPFLPGPIPPTGWFFGTLEKNATTQFELNLDRDLGETSIILAWNRRIEARRGADVLTGQPRWSLRPRLADFDLELLRLDADGQPHSLARSASRIDNVEHIYLPHLPPGRYQLLITRQDALDEPWECALAWRTEPPTAPPANAPAAPTSTSR